MYCHAGPSQLLLTCMYRSCLERAKAFKSEYPFFEVDKLFISNISLEVPGKLSMEASCTISPNSIYTFSLKRIKLAKIPPFTKQHKS